MNKIFSIFLCLLFGGCAYANSHPYFFINQQQGASISVYSRHDLTLKTEIPSLPGPAGIAVHSKNPWFAVTHPEQGVVSFYDSIKLIPLEHISVGGSPFGVVFVGDYLFYTDWSGGEVVVINPGTREIIKKIPVGKSPAGLAVDVCNSHVWVLNRESDSVSVIDSQSLTVIKTIPVGKAPFTLALDERYAFIANTQGNTLSIVDLNKLTEVKRVTVGKMPYGVAVDWSQEKVYVSNQRENTVMVLDSRSHQILDTLKTGEYPENIAFDERYNRVLILNWFEGSLSVFDNQQTRETKRLNVGDGSRAFGNFVGSFMGCPAADNKVK